MTEVVKNISLADLNKLDGFENYIEEKIKSPYEVKRLRNKDHLLILYTTGKLVVQGSNNPFTTQSTQENQVNEETLNEYNGSDETLKGDTFGG